MLERHLCIHRYALNLSPFLVQKQSCLQRIGSDETEPRTIRTRTRRDYAMEVYSFTVYFRTPYTVKRYCYEYV